MEVANILDNKEQNKIYGLMGNIDLTTNNSNIAIIKASMFNNTVKEYLNSKKSGNALKLVMLDENILEKKGIELSTHELKAISLAKALIENKDIIVLDYFDKEINYKEKDNYKRLFKKLVSAASKTIVIFTNDIAFLWDISASIIYVDNNKVINTFEKKDYFKLLEYIDKPIISEIIDQIRAGSIKIEDYKDIKDLLKAIYRIKEKENNCERKKDERKKGERKNEISN